MRLVNPKIYNPPREKESFVFPRYMTITIGLVVALLALLYLIFYSPVFKIRRIEIIGALGEKSQESLNSLKNHNIFLLDVAKIEQNLQTQHPEFLEVKIYRGLPDTVRVKFQEREPKVIWQSKGKFYAVDKEGILFKEKSSSGDLPVLVDNKDLSVEIPGQVCTPGLVEFVRNANLELEDMKLDIIQFEVNETTFQVDAVTKKFKILFDITRPFSDQSETLEKFLAEHKNEVAEYVDIRVEGWAYYK